MGIRNFLSKLGLRIAPKACAYCDGGSGVIEDRQRNTLRRCDYCDGTGLEASSLDELQSAVTVTQRHAGRPRNVA